MVKCSCGKIARYGTIMHRPIYCGDCRPDGTYNVVFARCLEKDCMVMPSFGKPGGREMTYCKAHKPEGYVNLRSRKCSYDECKKVACCRKNSDCYVEFCGEHAPEGYINDTIVRCKEEGCDTFATFAREGSRTREYCAVHCPEGYSRIIREERDCTDPISRTRYFKKDKRATIKKKPIVYSWTVFE
jgi:hypothetical protein